jgi:hypothetical protein
MTRVDSKKVYTIRYWQIVWQAVRCGLLGGKPQCRRWRIKGGRAMVHASATKGEGDVGMWLVLLVGRYRRRRRSRIHLNLFPDNTTSTAKPRSHDISTAYVNMYISRCYSWRRRYFEVVTPRSMSFPVVRTWKRFSVSDLY